MNPAEALFEVPPEGFVAARDKLAAALKSAGDAARAREIKALRRPTVAVWLVNQLARRDAKEVAAVLAAGLALMAAQREAMAGRGAGLAAASRELRSASSRAAAAAARLAGASGHPIDEHRVLQLLLAAATGSERERALLQAGQLEQELETASGFESAAGRVGMELPDSPAPAPRPSAAALEAASQAAARERERAIAALQRESDQADRHVATAKSRLADAEQAVTDARQALREAESTAAAAADRLRAARLPHT